MKNILKLDEKDSDIKTEILAGVSTFFATVYLFLLNPSILSSAGMPYNAVLTAGILIASLSCIAMGLFARSPLAAVPGAGLSYYAAFNLILDKNIPWETMLGAVFWSSILFLLLSLFRTRYYLNKAIPRQIRLAVSAGIGLLLVGKGLFLSGFLVSHPLTGLVFGGFNAVTLTFSVGMILTLFLCVRNIKSAFFLSIIFTTLISLPVGRLYGSAEYLTADAVPFLNGGTGFFSAPDFSLFLKLDFIGSLRLAVWPVIFSFFFIDLFESLAIYTGFSEYKGQNDGESEDDNLKRALIVSSASGILGGLTGSLPAGLRAESSVGFYTGGRTGLTSLVTGLLFLPLLFLSPILSWIPDMALAPVLIVSGGAMVIQLKKIDWVNFDEVLPAVIVLLIISLTQSILGGFLAGMVFWTILKFISSKRNEIGITLIIVDALAILYFILLYL